MQKSHTEKRRGGGRQKNKENTENGTKAKLKPFLPGTYRALEKFAH